MQRRESRGANLWFLNSFFLSALATHFSLSLIIAIDCVIIVLIIMALLTLVVAELKLGPSSLGVDEFSIFNGHAVATQEWSGILVADRKVFNSRPVLC